MPKVTLLTESELRQCVTLDKQAIDTVAAAFARLAAGEVIMPPVLSMDMPDVQGEVDVKTAYVPGLAAFAIKVSPGFFNNPAKGLPSLSGLMVLLCAETGVVQAVLLDNGYLTDVRTAAAGGVAARYLAPQQVQSAGIVGAGMQARLQAKALLLEREVGELWVWAPRLEASAHYADEQSQVLGIPVKVAPSVEALVKSSQVVITTTPARQALIKAEWLHPGLHITAMGSDAPDKNELAAGVLKQADYVVCDRVSQSLERGEMRTAVAEGVMAADAAVDELGALCAGQVPGRVSETAITVCDLTGTGVQDTAIANYTHTVAQQHGLGTVIEA